ncbi:MAG: bifunctional proline dehydrogenase/L-glutamate gamma-semialdehyde dehydrogenase PutA [Hyphomicrobiaceae bacterium]
MKGTAEHAIGGVGPGEQHRSGLRDHWVAREDDLVQQLANEIDLDAGRRERICKEAVTLISRVRADTSPSLMESLLAEYGLSTEEGIGLMCLAEALLRVPDPDTIDALISDKLEPGNWGAHLGKSASSLVNAATWALMLTGKVLDDDAAWPTTALRGLVKRLGEPVVRTAVSHAIGFLGEQFVLGRSISEALQNAQRMEALGYTYSYDMLGEAARTYDDAGRYQEAYAQAIAAAAARATGDIRTSPGISVKLSALNPRYEWSQRERVMRELVPATLMLARQAAQGGIGLNIDAEEANRLELSLEVVERVLADDALKGWDGLGVVVQAYGRRALPLIKYVNGLADSLDRRIMVRLVKGAYWDSEIKHAQALGLAGFPVFTKKAHTDISYLACARALIGFKDRIYPQFATHNAHTLAAIRELAGDRESYEFQRLHGMGEALHEIAREDYGTRCRIYAPVGAHEDLLAYLVRRLLENGANSSFVHQIVDVSLPPESIARDPVDVAFAGSGPAPSHVIRQPAQLFLPQRANSRGVDVNEPACVDAVLAEREPWKTSQWHATSTHREGQGVVGTTARPVLNPANPNDVVGHVEEATEAEAVGAITRALGGFPAWRDTPAGERAQRLQATARAYEAHSEELMALACRESGKTLADAVAEVREAVDFLNYYAGEIERLDAERTVPGRGVFVCISPWNFPLAIFTGQVAAALAAGNTVVAKPAEQTPLIAHRAVALMHEAGVPGDAVILVPGDGPSVGGPLSRDARIAGVCFTGSIEVGHLINRAMRANAGAEAVLIAETGGLNAMIIDSTALPEQVVRDVVTSAFQSAGQRCSALRMLYVQEEIYTRVMTMLFGAMDTLVVGDPWQLATDVGPVIDAAAQADIRSYCAGARQEGRLLKQIATPLEGTFVGPSVIAVNGIDDLPREVFGPVLHVARFAVQDLDRIVDAINARGYGLTFGLGTRIDDRVEQVVGRIRCGNVYVNRNQIGAVVGSQPFGGEGLSGTGPKAGGPHYVQRFRASASSSARAGPSREAEAAGLADVADGSRALAASTINAELKSLAVLQPAWGERTDRAAALDAALLSEPELMSMARCFDAVARTVLDLPGPTGESNRLSLHPRGVILCLGPTRDDALRQAIQALATGNAALIVAREPVAVASRLHTAGVPLVALVGSVAAETLAEVGPLQGVQCGSDLGELGAVARALAERRGAIVPFLVGDVTAAQLMVERHLCIDTTAAGGNASLLAVVGND